MQWNWLEEFVSPEKLEKAIGYLTYNVSVWAFFITVVVSVVTAFSIRAPLRESARARKAEADARRAEAEERQQDRSLDLLRIASGTDPKTGKAPGGMMQVVAIEVLADFPEYYNGYVSMNEWWKSLPASEVNPFVSAAMQRLVEKTKPK
jgi:hypothetical protein